MLRKFIHPYQNMISDTNNFRSADGSKTVEQYISAAAKIDTTVAPSKVQGGFLGAASAVVVPSSTATGAAATSSIQYGLGFTGLLAIVIAGLII